MIGGVSRLYDRVMEEGCDPLTLADLFKASYDANQQRTQIEEKLTDRLGREPSLREVTDDLHAVLSAAATKRADSAFDPSEFEGAVVVSAEEVADYWDGLPIGTDALDLLDAVVPPFERLFIEFRKRPKDSRGEVESWGILMSTTDESATEAMEARVASGDGSTSASIRSEARWLLHASLVIETKKGRPVGPVVRWLITLTTEGRVDPSGLIDGMPPLFATPIEIPTFPPEDAYSFADTLGGTYLAPALFAVSLMHCKNVKVRPVDPPERLSKKHERKTGKPLTRYHVLEIAPMRRILDTEGEAQTKGLSHALHICRGHFKTFTEDAPLFGKRVGTYWWPAHVRGNADEGVVEKDYRIRLDGDGIGQSYREADEEVTVAPAEVRPDDPDSSQRGLRAHNRTQNLLAAALTEAGFSPRSPKADEPDFDLAWVDGDTVWVAEVKSTTEKNEERQMRQAIGQVIRYRQKLSVEGTDARAMIAVENAPFDESWIDLCGREGIALVWPEVMPQALGS